MAAKHSFFQVGATNGEDLVEAEGIHIESLVRGDLEISPVQSEACFCWI